MARAAVAAALLAALIAAGAAPARAGDDDDDGASVISRLMHGLGLKNPDETVMGRGDQYSERSPLVVPPTRDLPPPVSDAAPPTPDWPKDPDIARKREAKKDNKAHYQRDYIVESSRPLSPSELNQRSSSSNPNDGQSTADSTMADPRDRGIKKSFFDTFDNLFHKQQYATFTGEPPRESLTDPPPGYLTPSPDQPYGLNQKPQPYHVQTLGERVEPTR